MDSISVITQPVPCNNTELTKYKFSIIESLKINKYIYKVIFAILFISIISFALLVALLVLNLKKPSNINSEIKSINSTKTNLSVSYSSTTESFCGITKYGSGINLNLNQIGRLIGGSNAIPHSQPWTVSLRIRNPDESISNHICGGSIVATQFVLTAAHCVYGYSADSIAVLVGLDNINLYTNQDIFFLENLWTHENYIVSNSIRNDIAILKLKNKIIESDTVSLICIPSDDDFMIEKYAIASGWGDTSNGYSFQEAENLQNTVLKIVNDNSLCSQNAIYDPDTIFCTIGINMNSNVCFGDSGGPLAGSSDNLWYLFGITSFVLTENNDLNERKCITNKPSYFTRVSKFKDWIIDKMSQ